MDVSLFCFQCRYTLQYTYPYAYYMESGPRKKLVRNKYACTPCLYCRTHRARSSMILHPPPPLVTYSPSHPKVSLTSNSFCQHRGMWLSESFWVHLSFSAVWVPAGPAGSRDWKPVVEGGAGWQLREGSGGRRGGAQRQWQRGNNSWLDLFRHSCASQDGFR